VSDIDELRDMLRAAESQVLSIKKMIAAKEKGSPYRYVASKMSDVMVELLQGGKELSLEELCEELKSGGYPFSSNPLVDAKRAVDRSAARGKLTWSNDKKKVRLP
jgi:hypothetical protein